ncbi:hypothetical protein ACPPVT_05575 [Angustibacter sp. McL0619]|uniref:hypothetical protein n=1 Tax=Angustibacter sp. McL0619 TaxID=3415676 RepID=UPI003CFB7F00
MSESEAEPAVESTAGSERLSAAGSERLSAAGSEAESAAPAAAPAGAADVLGALVAEAAAKSGLVWVRPRGGSRAWGVWHAWHEGAVLVASGPGEQDLGDLGVDVDLILRSKDTGSRLVTVAASAQLLDPSSQEWTAAAEALAPGRLNSAALPAELPEHWRVTGVRITRFVPTGEAAEQPGSYDDASGAAPPAPSAATTSSWLPWHLRGRRGRRARKAAERRAREQHAANG